METTTKNWTTILHLDDHLNLITGLVTKKRSLEPKI